jgi:hypothetical protein
MNRVGHNWPRLQENCREDAICFVCLALKESRKYLLRLRALDTPSSESVQSREALMVTDTLPRGGRKTLYRLSSWHQGHDQIVLASAGAASSGFGVSGVSSPLRVRLRTELLLQAELRLPITYVELAKHINVSSQATMVAIQNALEQLIDDDVNKGRPILAAVAVGGLEPGLPAPWFFWKVESRGLFAGDPVDVEAYAFHARELHRAFSFYGPFL